MRTPYKLKRFFIALISFFYWTKFTVWQYIFWKYSHLPQSEKQHLFIEVFNFPFIENAADLYLMELIQLPFMILNIYLVHSIQKRIQPVIFILVLLQAYLSALLNTWQLL